MSTTRKTEEALIDSGATECFLDHRTVSWLRLPPEPLKAPRTIHNIDGTHNQAGHITHKCRLKVQLGTIHQEMDFFITNLGQDRIVLGYPFLKLFNPNINWTKGNLTRTSTVSITPVHLWKHCQLVWKEDRVFCIRKTTFAQQWASKANEGKTTLTDSDIPAPYQDQKAVFSEEEAQRMPPSRDEDMQITFKEGAASQLDCKVYPLTKKEKPHSPTRMSPLPTRTRRLSSLRKKLGGCLRPETKICKLPLRKGPHLNWTVRFTPLQRRKPRFYAKASKKTSKRGISAMELHHLFLLSSSFQRRMGRSSAWS